MTRGFLFIVKLREREGHRFDSGRSLKGYLSIIDCQLWISISLKLYNEFGRPTFHPLSMIKLLMDQARLVEVRGGV